VFLVSNYLLGPLEYTSRDAKLLRVRPYRLIRRAFTEEEEEEAGTECETDGSENEGCGEADVCLQPACDCWADAKADTPGD